MVVQELYDTPSTLAIVLEWDDPHYIGSILPSYRQKKSNNSRQQNYLLGSVENLSHITSTAAAFSAHTLCRSIALNMVPFIMMVHLHKRWPYVLHLVVCHPCLLSLQQAFKLQIRLQLVQENYFTVDIFPGRVEEVGKEPADTGVGDVAAYNDELLFSWSLKSLI